ncbi:hypothetical protein J6590_064964 [Homalodisca vitripennis]|nr:hypothetical protein J6590_064964 [Homalodisca vitripennis]
MTNFHLCITSHLNARGSGNSMPLTRELPSTVPELSNFPERRRVRAAGSGLGQWSVALSGPCRDLIVHCATLVPLNAHKLITTSGSAPAVVLDTLNHCCVMSETTRPGSPPNHPGPLIVTDGVMDHLIACLSILVGFHAIGKS